MSDEDDEGLEPLDTESILGGGGWADPQEGIQTEQEQKSLDDDETEKR
jgi:hypothetical protein